MKFSFEEWTDREKGLKRQNKEAARGGESGGVGEKWWAKGSVSVC